MRSLTKKLRLPRLKAVVREMLSSVGLRSLSPNTTVASMASVMKSLCDSNVGA